MDDLNQSQHQSESLNKEPSGSLDNTESGLDSAVVTTHDGQATIVFDSEYDGISNSSIGSLLFQLAIATHMPYRIDSKRVVYTRVYYMAANLYTRVY